MGYNLSSLKAGRILLTCLITLFVSSMVFAVDNTYISKKTITTLTNNIDSLVQEEIDKHGLSRAQQCSDSVFIRRVYLDLTGSLPPLNVTKSFLKNKNRNKRSRLIDELFEHDAFADYWSMKWCDILRVKAEFPINLWPNAVQAYHHWIRTAIATNMPYDKFVRELLTSSGSNFRTPQVNFYRALQGKTPEAIARAVALTFMGSRYAKWDKYKQDGFKQAFTRLSFKSTAEWKEEIVTCNHSLTEELTINFPDGRTAKVEGGSDPRQTFANWLISKDNRWFARCAVNRIWYWLMGRGIINPVDDIRTDNPPVNERLLKYLEGEFIRSNYDTRHIMKLIINSQTYQQSSIPTSQSKEVEKYFAVYPVRRLDAEVLIDALCEITGTTEKYSSSIPEPFSFIPENEHSIKLADGSITSPFLELFGRPPRDTGEISERNNLPTKEQSLHMLNSTHIREKILKGYKLKQLFKKSRGRRRAYINDIYLTILSRRPTNDELMILNNYSKTSGLKGRAIAEDIIWALINSKEFMYQH